MHILLPVTDDSYYPSVISRRGNNGHRNYFIINLHESYVAGLGLKFTTPESAARPAVEQAEEAKNFLLSLFIKYTSLRPSESFLG